MNAVFPAQVFSSQPFFSLLHFLKHISLKLVSAPLCASFAFSLATGMFFCFVVPGGYALPPVLSASAEAKTSNNVTLARNNTVYFFNLPTSI